MATLEESAARLPTGPGVYLFRDRAGDVLYVGKAKNLRARVKQYLSGHDERRMVPHMVASAGNIDVVLVETEKEALILENSLIKQHNPPYNVRLRDDKNFLHLAINPKHRWPRYRMVRQIRPGSVTFGPYSSASKARKTLAWLQRSFPLRTCSDQVLKSRKTPCLLYQMGRCVAPCVDGLTTKAEYSELVAESMLLLKGKRGDLIKRLEQRMMAAADVENYEEAARLRDLVQEIRQTLEKQTVVDRRLGDRDVWGVFMEGDRGSLCVLPVREGSVKEPAHLRFDGARGALPELLSAWLNTYYQDDDVPPEILLPELPEDAQVLAEALSERRGGKVVIKVPQRGDKARVMELALQNARDRYRRQVSDEDRRSYALNALAELLGLEEPPHRIECVDNSNIQGENPVASCVVFIDGAPAKKHYRHYRIKTVVGSDDYASMAEVLTRRFTRAAKDGVFPDLLVVDGGRGQLNVALGVLAELGMEDQPVIGLAKPKTEKRKGEFDAVDKIILPDFADAVRLPDNHPALNVLRYIRNESHRFAIRFHRRTRNKSTLASALEQLQGVGPKRRKALLTHFGSLKRVKNASATQIAQVSGIGPAMAEQIFSSLKQQDQSKQSD